MSTLALCALPTPCRNIIFQERQLLCRSSNAEGRKPLAFLPLSFLDLCTCAFFGAGHFGLQNWKPKLCGHGMPSSVQDGTSFLLPLCCFELATQCPNSGKRRLQRRSPFQSLSSALFGSNSLAELPGLPWEFFPPAGKKTSRVKLRLSEPLWLKHFRHSFDIPAKTLEAPGIWLSQLAAAALAPVLSLLGTFGRGPKTRPSKGRAAEKATHSAHTQNKVFLPFRTSIWAIRSLNTLQLPKHT